jgi:pSer/pThr/pTyr-binding forkhead associated (FHA) protein
MSLNKRTLSQPENRKKFFRGAHISHGVPAMATQVNGKLVPIGGGDVIPLLRERLTLGRRESCDICLRFPNVSGHHCELYSAEGVWHIRDMGSTNGTKVNGQPVQDRALRPGDEITIAKRRYTIQYALPKGRTFENLLEEDLSQSLLEKAGLARSSRSFMDEE